MIALLIICATFIREECRILLNIIVVPRFETYASPRHIS